MSAQAAMKLNLTPEPEIITTHDAPLVYLEKVGPFMKQAPLAWKEFWAIATPLMENGAVDKDNAEVMAGLSYIDPRKQGDESFVYQAGLIMNGAPRNVPAGLKTRTLQGGLHARFLLTGSYHQLPQAYPAAIAAVEAAGLKTRDAFFIEKYLNNPSTTPEAELKTEILVPLA